MIALVSKFKESRFDFWKFAFNHDVTRFFGKNSIDNLLNRGENLASMVSGAVVKTVNRIFPAWMGRMVGGWRRIFLYS